MPGLSQLSADFERTSMVRPGNILVIVLAASITSVCEGQTTARAIVTVKAVTTKGPIVTTKGPIVTTKGPIVTTKGPVVTTKGPVVTSPKSASHANSATFAAYKEAAITVSNNVANKALTSVAVTTTLAPEGTTDMAANLLAMKNLVEKIGSSFDKLYAKTQQIGKTFIHPGDDPDERMTVLLRLANDKPYWVYVSPQLTYEDAFKRCKEFGLQLLSIESKEENLAVSEFVLPFDEMFWTSGNDLETVFSFVWKSTGKAFGYSNFNPGDPNNAGGNERCVTVYHMKGSTLNMGWVDENCVTKYAFVCEKP